jgi:hypothetical protein
LEQSCPWGTAYSDLPGGFCDYLEYVDCGGRSTTSTTTTTTAPPPPVVDDEPIEPDVIPEDAEPVSSQIAGNNYNSHLNTLNNSYTTENINFKLLLLCFQHLEL